ncbi:tRNA pseudouridine(38-40) synthase TruA [Spirochaeta dissipatitropha]
MISRQRNICLEIQYDGTDFCGWQVQHNQRSVQGEIEKALAKLHRKSVDLYSAGRTDSGVHARAQRGNFFSSMDSVPAEKFASALNSMLPQDVRIQRSWQVADDFHATRDAVERRYRYYMYPGKFAQPLLDRYRLRLPVLPDILEMNRMASLLVGTHDFTSLASCKNEKTMIRTVYSAHFFYDDHGMVFEISGAGFLWKMVRSIIGTMLAIADFDDPAGTFSRILEARDRSAGGKTAPPHGLVLYSVAYPSHKEQTE